MDSEEEYAGVRKRSKKVQKERKREIHIKTI